MKRLVPRRSGIVLICVLACLVVVTGIAVAMVKSALMARKAVRQERQKAQVELLLEAGIQRAVARFASDTDYAGESWDLPAEIFSNADAARIDIEVLKTEQQSPTITVVAQFPAGTPLSVRRSHTFTVSNEE
jgi:type II secretory pathway component PulK